jgi:hypothetical protein
MMHGLAAREAARKPSDYPLWKRDELPADPRLEGIDLLHPDHDVGRIHDRGTAQQQVNDQEAKLRSYGWIDRKAGTVRIPIEEAMKKVAGNLPSRPGSTTEEFYQAPSASSSGRMPRGELP